MESVTILFILYPPMVKKKLERKKTGVGVEGRDRKKERTNNSYLMSGPVHDTSHSPFATTFSVPSIRLHHLSVYFMIHVILRPSHDFSLSYV